MVISMDRWRGKVAIVTGASSGVGAGIAESLVKEGMLVAGLARRKEKIEELSKKLEGSRGKLYAIKTDVTKEEEILAAFKWVRENLGPVHVLVNNAGIIRNTNLREGDTKMWKEIFDTNTLAYCIATREAFKDMKANKVDGQIIHINTIGGHTVPDFACLSVYSGSKFAVTALTETLRKELNSIGSKIRITSISPGVVRTDLVVGCGLTKEQLEGYWETGAVLEPEDIGDAVVYVLSTAQRVQIHEMIIRANGEE